MHKILYRLITAVMLLGGTAVLLYPTISNWIAVKNSSSVVYEYTEEILTMTAEEKAAEYAKALDYNRLLSGNGVRDPFVPNSGIVLPDDYLAVLNVGGTMGYLEIPKIDVNLPIYHGTSEATLKKGLGHLEATAMPIGGEGNHTVLTGHRGLPSAKLLTDLDRMEIGDKFYITVLDDIIAYEVDQIITIEPNDTSELLPVPGEDYVTLITCTPYSINTHRLLVRGTRIDYAEEEKATAGSSLKREWLMAGGVAAFLIIWTIVVWNGKKNKKKV